MNTTFKRMITLTTGAIALFVGQYACAVSPATVAQGKQLFERNWPAGNPLLGGDGLGPLFNGQSCVACHHQGGVGGGGDSRFNAKTIGIEKLQITGPVNQNVIAKMVGAFHPGFVRADGTVVNTLTLPHHGGSAAFQKMNANIMAHVPGEFSESGGSSGATDVRSSYATPIQFHQKIGNNAIVLHARLFQRNTTSLFGAGLIDGVDARLIVNQSRAQDQHPEISGRPSTLKNGRIGRFGWRGNVASLVEFVDQACANEVGLETRRKTQGQDPLNRGYRNPSIDIADNQVEAMKDFIAALPAPTREIPQHADDRALVARGESVFSAVGCAVCHVPNMGPARGVYSDLLLHEMGYELIDLNHAEPYVVRRTPIQRTGYENKTTVTTESKQKVTIPMGEYYGGTTYINTDITTDTMDHVTGRRTTSKGRAINGKPLDPMYGHKQGASPRNALARRNRGTGRAMFSFVAPDYPGRLINIVELGTEGFSKSATKSTVDGNTKTSKTTSERYIKETYVRVHYEPTNFNEEWRTPPLWGLRDSAPYMHDGRAETVLESIAMHDGEAAGTRDRFLQLSLADRHAVLAFLNTLVAPANVPQPTNL